MANIEQATPEKTIATAFEIYSEWQNSQISLDDLFERLPTSLPLRCRGSVKSLLFALFRHRGSIVKMIDSLNCKLKGKDRRLLEIASVMIHYQNSLPPAVVVDTVVQYAKKRFSVVTAKFFNAVLHKIVEMNPQQFTNDLPNELLKHWSSFFSKSQIQQMCDLFVQEPDFSFRIIKQKAKNFKSSPIDLDFLPRDIFFVAENPSEIIQSEFLKKGQIYIQDPATFWAIALMLKYHLQPKTIWDACAAPGGKTLLLTEFLNPSQITVSDRSEIRQKRTAENLALRKAFFPSTQFVITSMEVEKMASLNHSFDCVFLDVPCSNSGVFRHRPDALWRFSKTKIEQILPLQKSILDHAQQCVKDQGYLLYSTCSIDSNENQNQIQLFLQQYPHFKLIEQQTLLPTSQNDGAFAALLQRTGI